MGRPSNERKSHHPSTKRGPCQVRLREPGANRLTGTLSACFRGTDGRTKPAMIRFAVAFVAVLTLGSADHAGVEIGGTAGLHLFSEDNQLGSPDGMVTQANSSLFGLRLGMFFTPMLGVELEGGLIPTESRGGVVTFDIYDAT